MKVELTDQHEDDFIRGVLSVKATRDDGRAILWKLPKRLMQRPGMTDIVVEEMFAEMEEMSSRG